ncbi:5'-methylthioadenosine phosphorylase [Minicystis rosea]|nr:5'-methylthioadenosine phosphorylase [Minicystis rosea]
MSSTSGVLAVIGGSGLYDVENLENVEEIHVSTPYGAPSDAVIRGRLREGGATVLFLPRHGRGHRHPPSAIPYRANICALKMLGATHLLSVSAVGSMKEEIAPGDLVVVDQFIDLTKQRVSTFFDAQVAAHVAFSDPVCPIMASAVHAAAEAAVAAAPVRDDGHRPARAHKGGAYVCIEGPQFSTRAESLVYRTWGVSVIGMTNMPEAKLAREAELPFATLALSTDYDCWHATEETVTVEMVVATLKRNVALAKDVTRRLARSLPDVSQSPARDALRGAIMTAPSAIPEEARVRLEWLIGRYLG